MSARPPARVPLHEVERVLEDACGLALSPGIQRVLGEAFQRAARESRLGADAFLERLRVREPLCVTALVEAAVVGETYFFRHPEQLDAVRQLAIDAAPRDRPLRIWSAGCASGEEPYSLAMELLDAGRGGSAGDRVLATDVSARALATAKAAVYGEWSLRRLDPLVRQRHFELRPPNVVVRPEVRALVELRRHNLVKDPPPGNGFDVVVCRNVLIYFTAPTAVAVVERLASALRPGGLLVLGPVETPLAAELPLERIEVSGATVHRRAEGHGAASPRRIAERAPREPLRRRSPAPRRAPPAPAPVPDVITGREAVRQSPGPRQVAAALDASREAVRQGAGAKHVAAALDAARRGDLPAAERLAREAATQELCPEAWLLVSMAADARGDLPGAVEAVRRALYLDPGLALGHAALVPLYAQLGLADDAARARRNALDAIAGLDDATPLRGVETITAGALRSALEARQGPARLRGSAWSEG
jgi:chemotaxis protein methyltransferase CheR